MVQSVPGQNTDVEVRTRGEPHHETPALIAALSDSALCRASSAAIFQRGKTYATSGAVQVLSEEPGDTPAIYAQVAGSDTYETEVWIHEGEVEGACDCANAQDGWFCKHQVALALVWRERLSGEAPAVDEGRWARFALGWPDVVIGGGTPNIQKNIIAERILGLPKD